MKLKGKVAVVTGASTGIGRAVAQAFAKEGAFVYLLGRNVKGLEETLSLINNNGRVYVINLKMTPEIRDFMDILESEKGHVDILANIAGVYHNETRAFSGIEFTDYSEDDIRETLKVGINAPMLLSYYCIPLMPKGSKIVNVSGTFDSGAKGWLPYYLSKKSLEDLTVGLAQELKDKDIQVNCISPSDTLTKSYMKFFPEYAKEELCLKPEEIGKFALYLASSEADCITGQVITIKHP